MPEKLPEFPKELPEETKKKLDEIKKKLETLTNKVREKFDKYIVGVALLPPSKEEINKKNKKEKEINVLTLIDDTDSKTMSKEELKAKLDSIITELSKNIDENIKTKTVLLTELWQDCFVGKFELVELFGISAPIFDKGIVSALKIADIHKKMVLNKFEKYIVSYVLFGSLPRGEARLESDIDIAIIIDDTDVKRMSRIELKDKLRAIIISMGMEAEEITGIKHKLNVQTYILTDFWESMKNANPVIFTVLRDGIPLYDRGIFMPWKQLLKMGKIRPSQEAIDIFMATSEEMIKNVKLKMKMLVESEIYWSTLNATQAAIMLYGLAPPTPKETIELIQEIFVQKEKLLEREYVDIMKKIRDFYKDVEEGKIKEVKGKELDDFLYNAEKYMKRIKRLFEQISEIKRKEKFEDLYNNVVNSVRDILKLESNNIENDTDRNEKTNNKDNRLDESNLVHEFNHSLIQKGKIAKQNLKLLESIFVAKEDFDLNKLTKTEMEKTGKDYDELMKNIIEHMQRKNAHNLSKAKIRVKVEDKFGEVLFLQKSVYITKDLTNNKTILKAKLKDDGSFDAIRDATSDEMEEDLSKEVTTTKSKSIALKEKTFEELKKLFGKDVEVLL